MFYQDNHSERLKSGLAVLTSHIYFDTVCYDVVKSYKANWSPTLGANIGAMEKQIGVKDDCEYTAALFAGTAAL